MEQTNITPTLSEAVKHFTQDKSDTSGIWNLKKKKARGKNFFSDLVKSLSTAVKKNETSANQVQPGSQLKKGVERLMKNTEPNEPAAINKEKKKIPNIKIDQSEEKKTELTEKNDKLKDKKKKLLIIAPEIGERPDTRLAETASTVKNPKISLFGREVGEADSARTKASDNEKTKKTIVIDLRKHAEALKDPGVGADARAQQADPAIAVKVSGVKGDQLAYFGTGQAGQGSDSRSTSTEKSTSLFSAENAKTFQDILRNELITNTRFIIKNGGSGELQIELKPESLGRLRFKVNLENNRIDGKIFVENNNVKEMVEQSVQNLSDALMQEGFESVNIQVSLGGDSRRDVETNSGSGFEYAGKHTAELEKAVPAFDYLDMDNRIINMYI